MNTAAKRVTGAIFLVNVLALLWRFETEAFNINTQNVKIFSGIQGTHFGYTVSFDAKVNTQGRINLLIGAPKAKTDFPQGHWMETGSLVTCFDVVENIEHCQKADSDIAFPELFNQDNVAHARGGYGFGLSVFKDGTRLVCAPFWKDVNWVKDLGVTFVPGRCVATLHKGGTPQVKYIQPYFRGWQYISSGQYFTGLASFGMSADIHENSIFAVGLPGLLVSEGGVAIIDYRQDELAVFSTSKEYRNTLGTTAYGYLGYQVTFGRFCNPQTICFAAGAPNMFMNGQVRFYKWSNEELLVNFQTLRGEEPWAYYGSVLCAADTDGDQIDELLVGAPYYQTGSHLGFDSGKVYVYKRQVVSKFFHLLQELDGSRAPWSKFGSAIQTIGDINFDSYSDVAIGAPGEEDGRGCIYIYLGHTGGGVTLSQRICASQIRGLKPPIRGFGSTIAESTYLDDSAYPIFAVGMFQSDKALVLRTSPILDVDASLSVNPNPIDVEKPCTHFTSDGPCAVVVVCMEHAIRKSRKRLELQDNQEFRIGLKLGGQSNSRGPERAALYNGRDLVYSIEEVVEVAAKGSCFEFQTVTKADELEKDRFTPIQVEFSYSLEHNQQFVDSHSPILDPLAENKRYQMITFENDCGSDNICKVDLKVGQILIYPTDDDGDGVFITLGNTKEVTVLITVKNSEEVCYWTEIQIKLNQRLSLRTFNSDTIRQCVPILDPKGTNILCSYYEPLDPAHSIGVTFTFETDNLAHDKESLIVSTEARSKDQKYNPEIEPRDNKIQQATNIYIITNASILGNAIPLEMKINKRKKIAPDVRVKPEGLSIQKSDVASTLTLNHKFLVKSKGPSFLPKTNLILTVPVLIPDGTLLVVDTLVKLISGKHVVDCSKSVSSPIQIMYPTTTAATTQGSVEEVGNNTFVPVDNERSKRETGDEDDQEDADNDETDTYIMSCDKTPEYCLKFTCGLPEVIQPGGHAELNVTLTLDSDNVPLPEGMSSFRLELKTVLEEPNHKLLKSWNETNEKQVVAVTHTTLHLYESGGEVEVWIIVVSVGAGLLFIALIVLVCWKLGFFERKRHFQVKKWQRESLKRASQRSRRESHKNSNE